MAMIALVGAIFALVTPWWSWRGVASMSDESTAITLDFYFGERCITVEAYPPDSNRYCPDYDRMPSTQRTLGLTQVQLIIGLFFSVPTLYFIVQSMSRQDCKTRALASGIITSTFLLMSTTYLFTNLPGDLTSDAISSSMSTQGGVTGFFGSASGTVSTNLGIFSYEMQYGGGVGWYMAVISSLLTMIGVTLAFLGARSIQKSQRLTEFESVSTLENQP